MSGTDAPIEHVRVDCLSRHWFLMPTENLTEWPDMPTPVVLPVRESQPGSP
jgi:hypothetical protein